MSSGRAKPLPDPRNTPALPIRRRGVLPCRPVLLFPAGFAMLMTDPTMDDAAMKTMRKTAAGEKRN